MPHLISPNQASSFTDGRCFTDNILVAQQILHKFKFQRERKGFMAWKIDFSKAYEKLSWNFIQRVLHEVGLPISSINLIMSNRVLPCCLWMASGNLSSFLMNKDAKGTLLLTLLACSICYFLCGEHLPHVREIVKEPKVSGNFLAPLIILNTVVIWTLISALVRCAPSYKSFLLCWYGMSS